MAQTKFKVGDRVRCIHTRGAARIEAGRLYTVSQVGPRNEGIYLAELTPGPQNFTADHFELADLDASNLKVGDKVTIEITIGYVGLGGRAFSAPIGSASAFDWNMLSYDKNTRVISVERALPAFKVGDKVTADDRRFTGKAGTVGAINGQFAWITFDDQTAPTTRYLSALKPA